MFRETNARKSEAFHLVQTSTLSAMVADAFTNDRYRIDGSIMATGLIGFIQDKLMTALDEGLKQSLPFNVGSQARAGITNDVILDFKRSTLSTVFSPSAIYLMSHFNEAEDGVESSWTKNSAILNFLLKMRDSCAAAIGLISNWDAKGLSRFQNDPTALVVFVDDFKAAGSNTMFKYMDSEWVIKLLTMRTHRFSEYVLIKQEKLISIINRMVERLTKLDHSATAWSNIFSVLTVSSLLSLAVEIEQLHEMIPESSNITTGFSKDLKTNALAKLQQLCSALLYAPLAGFIDVIKRNIEKYASLAGLNLSTGGWNDFTRQYDAHVAPFIQRFIPSFSNFINDSLTDPLGLLGTGILDDLIPQNFLKKLSDSHKLGDLRTRQLNRIAIKEYDSVKTFHSDSTIAVSTELAQALRHMPLFSYPVTKEPRLIMDNSELLPRILLRLTYAFMAVKTHDPAPAYTAEAGFDIYNCFRIYPNTVSSSVLKLTTVSKSNERVPIKGCLPNNSLYTSVEFATQILMDWDHNIFSSILKLSKQAKVDFAIRNYLERIPDSKDELKDPKMIVNIPGLADIAGYYYQAIYDEGKAKDFHDAFLTAKGWQHLGPAQLGTGASRFTISDIIDKPVEFLQAVTSMSLADILGALSSPGSAEYLVTHLSSVGLFVVVPKQVTDSVDGLAGGTKIALDTSIFRFSGLGLPYGLSYDDCLKLTRCYAPHPNKDLEPVSAFNNVFARMTPLGFISGETSGNVFFLPFEWLPSISGERMKTVTLPDLRRITVAEGVLNQMTPIPYFTLMTPGAHFALESFAFAPSSISAPDVEFTLSGVWDTNRFLCLAGGRTEAVTANYPALFNLTDKWAGVISQNGLRRTSMPVIYGKALTGETNKVLEGDAVPTEPNGITLSLSNLERKAESVEPSLAKDQASEYSKVSSSTAVTQLASTLVGSAAGEETTSVKTTSSKKKQVKRRHKKAGDKTSKSKGSKLEELASDGDESSEGGA